MPKCFCGLIACIFFHLTILAQCPAQDILWKRINYLRASTLPAKDMLRELQAYLSKINACPYKNDSTHTSLLGLVAGLYFETGNYLNAIKYRRQAIDIITANADKPSVKLTTLPVHYYGLSLAYDSLNNFPEKMKALDSCATIALRINFVDRTSLTALYTFLMHYFDIGDYRRCIDYAIRCQSFARQYKINNTPQEQVAADYFISSSLVWQVIALMKLKNFIDAETLLVNKVADFKKAGLTNYLGTTFSQLAEVQLNKGDFEKAHMFYELALKYDQKSGYTFSCKQTLKDIGYTIYYSHLKDDLKAMACYKKALNLLNEDKNLVREDAFESLDIYAKMAEIYVRRRVFDSAFFYFQRAFDQIKPGTDERGILHSSANEIIRYKKIHYLTRLFLDKGDAFLLLYKDQRQKTDIQNAIAVFKVTDQLLDRIRNVQKDPMSKLFWRNDSRRLYENAIEASQLADQPEDAFYFFEKSRAVLLSDQLNEQHWQNQKEIRQQTGLKKNILQLEREISLTEKSSPRSAELQTDLFNRKQELDRIQQAIKSSHPLYYQSFLDTGFISLQDVRKNILGEHQALIELFAGDSAVYILVVTAKSVQIKKINKPEFDNLTGEFTNYISNPVLLNVHYPAFIETSRRLYQLLFQKTEVPKGRIILSPDGRYFPLEALVISSPNQALSYFIDEHAVSYTYSARYLLNTFAHPSKAFLFMGMAPVNFSLGLGLPSLPGSEQALQRLRSRFKEACFFTEENASRINFLQQFYNYKIIQLYTHATDSGYNGEPMIYFRDSTLLLSDLLYENRPATSLIVLSACKTAAGKLYQGEGVFSFNRGFAALGIPSSVTNLWQVDNESTYRLTELFYKWLAKELPVDVALQKAKLEFIKTATREKQLPYYWAAPVLTGKSDTIPIDKTYQWGWIAGIIGLTALSAWVLKRRINAKPSR